MLVVTAVGGEREIGRAPAPIHASDAIAIALLVAAEALAVCAVIRIWRARGRSLASNLVWTVVTLIPVVGLLAYVVWRDPPAPPSDPTDRHPPPEWPSP